MKTPWIASIALALTACGPTPEQLDSLRGARADVYFNDPGSRPDNLWRPDILDIAVDMVNGANNTIDLAVMGFSYRPLADALVKAHKRGVRVRMVGDAGHLTNYGYTEFEKLQIPKVVGNSPHIMHDKFMVIDGHLIFGGTANWSNSDLIMNSNNFFTIDSPYVAQDFTDEFEQMFNGAFGNQKVEIDNGRVYEVGDTKIEVFFSPNEDGLGRMLELIDAAEESVRFTIFAFTKDQVGSALARKQELWSAEPGYDPEADYHDRKGVVGVIDQSQLHSNGQYHEVFRLLNSGVDVRMDGNDSTILPGDYQAGGGRLHSKTMIIDAYGENPVVISGSFNWSAAATQSNDEYLMVFHGPRVAQLYDRYFDTVWNTGKRLGGDRVGENDVKAGDLVINEVMWFGLNSQDEDGFDEMIELRNTSDEELNLDLWQIANGDDFVVGLPPGSRIAPGGLFTILDHTLEPYLEGAPQDELSAFRNGDLVLNAFNDNRQARMYLKDTQLELFLKDPDGNVMDRAGDGGPAFLGGPDKGNAYSMERNESPGDGSDPDAWHVCGLDEGGANVTEAFKDEVIASPGEPNSD